jgi:very-short-patch-repair endonuclease
MRDMVNDNPMRNPGVRRRVMRRLHKRRAGKGLPSICERLVALALHGRLHVSIPTHRRGIYPPYYAVDVAFPSLRVAVEVDGPSHRGQAAQKKDRKKARLLRSLGWRIYRCTNEQLRTNYDGTIDRLRRLIRGGFS